MTRSEQQRHRALQGRPAFPYRSQREHPQVPGLRTNRQERADRAAHGRRERRRELQSQVAAFPDATYHEGEKPWGVACDIALPCATQNELDEGDARTLLANGCLAVVEGANMPATRQAADAFREAGILFAPGKAANAGGVAVSGLEMSQNAQRRYWDAATLDTMLQDIMSSIHERCLRYGASDDGTIDYVRGANIAGFKKVADAMLAYGVV